LFVRGDQVTVVVNAVDVTAHLRTARDMPGWKELPAAPPPASLAAPVSLSAESPAAPTAPAVSGPPQMGVYRWANQSTNIDAFERWLGGPLVWAEDFVGNETWDNVAWPVWWLEGWSPWKQQKPGRRLILSIPLLPGPRDGSGPLQGDAKGEKVSLEEGAAGKYNARFKILAENIVKHHLGDTILRLGWEFNGGWYTWRASGKEAAFAEYWRQIVKTMRAVPGAEQLQFCWNPTLGYQQFPAEKAWPGDEFVDFVGVDVYDESWIKDGYPWPAGASAEVIEARRTLVWNDALLHGDHGLAFWSKFARAHGKPLTIPEWGVNNRVDMKDQHGGLDNVYFIEQMHRFIMDPTNHIAFHSYFDVQAGDGHHQLSPGASGTEKTEFPELFGAAR